MVVSGDGLAQPLDDLDELLGPAVVEIVAIDRRDDDMLQAELAGRDRDMLRLPADRPGSACRS